MKINLNDPELKALIDELLPIIFDAAKGVTGSIKKWLLNYLKENAGTVCVRIAVLNIIIPIILGALKSLESTGSVKQRS